MNSVINVDLTEIITMNPEVYPYPTAEEHLESVCDEPFLVDTKLEELLPRFKGYADDNFGCQIEFHTLCTIEGHTSIQLKLRHFLGKLEAETTFSLVHTKGLANLLKETVKMVGNMVAPLIDFKHNQAKTVIANSNMCMQHVDVHRYIRQ